ncbi:biotin carboxylase N-terminal domain-containing protein [Carboxylicivirga sp. N1Y90]|uniref:acetyl/propionyl/methylcrotonyl-CoA carboxylase subunit alpha n=1 Tax=Carboxylicivirga fragile TaxID=3417571 RepID=UPI003D345ED8|nr:biotin/lipoyl-binding protein [Marinilabiliaceae bacterium N1Y90]
MIKKVLIPNRGEIAVRIINAAQALGIKTVVTLSKAEADTLPAKMSDEVHYFEHDSFENSYLDIPQIISLCQTYGADSVHPGYGFLAENHNFVRACEEANITFIGPSANNLETMGDKQMARQIARKAKVPLTPSWEGSIQEILSQTDQMSFPVLVKAAMGGGGKGMVICNNEDELIDQLPIVARQALRYFGDDRIYVERYISSPRHIEVQVLADEYGNTIHLFERECSVQRRFQKIIEEAPAPNLSQEKREELCADAIKLCKKIGYKNAGTLEFLLNENGEHYFLEMNTRIQVEHCVSEEITGIDLVKWQFKIANKEPLSIQQNDVKINGHSLEARIYAENPDDNFKPSPGTISYLSLPTQAGLRKEIAFDEAVEIHPQFDPMIAKIVSHKSSRIAALEHLQSGVENMIIHGIKTNTNYLRNILNHPFFIEGKVDTHFCSKQHEYLLEESKDLKEQAVVAYALFRLNPFNGTKTFWRLNKQIQFKDKQREYNASFQQIDKALELKIDQKKYQITKLHIEQHQISFKLGKIAVNAHCFNTDKNFEVIIKNQMHQFIAKDILPAYNPNKTDELDIKRKSLNAPLPGQVMKILINEGQEVKKGDVLIILEAMKMENHLCAWKDGTIDKIHIQNGHKVKSNQLLVTTK